MFDNDCTLSFLHAAARRSKSNADVESEIRPKSVKKRSHSAASASLKSNADVESESEIKPKSVKKRSDSAPIIQSCACKGGCKNNQCPCRRLYGKPWQL